MSAFGLLFERAKKGTLFGLDHVQVVKNQSETAWATPEFQEGMTRYPSHKTDLGDPKSINRKQSTWHTGKL